MKKILGMVVFVVFFFLLIGCSYSGPSGQKYYYKNPNRGDEHQELRENPFIKTEINSKSNISLSSNTAAYSFIRSQIDAGKKIDKNAVRIEELVNFFRYNYNQPEDDKVFGFKSELIQTPWNNDTHLLIVGLETKKVELKNVSNNIVILLDVSGSMSDKNKLPLVKESMKLLLKNMKPNDIISLVTYSSGEKVIFEGKTIKDYEYIVKRINVLNASGSTAGERGLKQAYDIARKYFIENGNNRIIIATDGDFNVGISDTNKLVEYISLERESGIYFSAFGFGYGNYKDEKLERLAKAGNGVYHYIDDIVSARKAFVEDIDGILYTVARDAKAQITFNEEVVLEHRLIGYENRQLSNEEFDDDKTDAGEIGTGLQVTAIYELKLKENNVQNLGSVSIRYKNNKITNNEVYEENYNVINVINQTPSSDANFISGVVEFGLLLLDSDYKVNANINKVIERLEKDNNNLQDYYRKDFIDLLKKYKKIIQ